MLKQSLFLIIFSFHSLAVPFSLVVEFDNCKSEYPLEKKAPITCDLSEEWDEEEDNKIKWLSLNCNFSELWIEKSISAILEFVDTSAGTRFFFTNYTSLIIWIQNFRI